MDPRRNSPVSGVSPRWELSGGPAVWEASSLVPQGGSRLSSMLTKSFGYNVSKGHRDARYPPDVIKRMPRQFA